ncbi:MAG: right-handed parallel beta-helix repeat-containing protein [Ferruginibacter sp.]
MKKMIFFLLAFLAFNAEARRLSIPKNGDGGWYKPEYPKLKPGDTVILKGSYAYWNLENVNGTADSPIVFRNETGRSRIGIANNYAAIFYNCSHFIIDGSGDSTYKYGIVFGPVKGFYIPLGLTTTNSTDYEVKHVELTHMQVGIFSSPDTGRTMYNVWIHHNWVHDMDNPAEKGRSEGFYIGNTSIRTIKNTAHFENIRITNNLLEELSGDGIQLCDAQGFEVSNNIVRNYGKANLEAQRTGILIGSNSMGTIKNNLIENGPGNGIELFGYGLNTISGNVLKNTGKALLHDAILIQKFGIDGAPLKVNCFDNVIEGASRNGITNNNTMETGRPGKWTNNKISGVGGKKYYSKIGDIVK